MNLFDAIKTFFSKSFNFDDRATRAEFWLSLLFAYVAFLVPIYFAATVYVAVKSDALFAILIALVACFALVLFIPFLAVSVRRLHDTGKSGWLLLLHFVPLGQLVIFYFMLEPSDLHENKYGPNEDYEYYKSIILEDEKANHPQNEMASM